MGAAVASITVLGAALLGGFLRLVLYPQFLVGVILLLGSLLLKLSRNLAGVVVVIVTLLVVIVLATVFNGKILRALKKSAPAAGRQAKAIRDVVTKKASQGVASTPPYAYSVLIFLIPAFGQFLGSMATVRMLSSLDVSPNKLPGAGYATTFSLMYLLSLTTGVDKKWTSPSKVSFLMQSFMVLRALTTSSAKDLHLNTYLPSVLAGWGSLLISLTPGTAFVGAAKAAAASAALAGAGVASFEGVKTLAGFGKPASSGSGRKSSKRKSGQAAIEEEPEAEQSNPGALVNFDKMYKDWTGSFDEKALRAWANDNLSKEALAGVLRKALPKTRANQEDGDQRFSNDAQESNLDDDDVNDQGDADEEAALDADQVDTTGIEQVHEGDSDTPEADPALKEEIDGSGIDATVLSPPLKVAIPLVLFRALPTCLTLVVGVTMSIFALLRGRFKPGMLAIPVILSPFAAGEIVMLVRKIGVGVILSGGPLNKRNVEKFTEEYQDGMSLMLWQSPTMLKAWRSISSVQNPEALIDDLSKAPSQWLRPDQETVDAAPELSKRVVAQLVGSVVIDVIGSSSYAIPALGEMTDFIWAPTQAFLIQRMYNVPGLSYIGFFEEILPFTDVLPTAVISWFYVYGEFLPSWTIRARQRLLTKKRKAKTK